MLIKDLPDLNGSYFLTPQEHMFFGSSSGKEFSEHPYRPLVVQEGWDASNADYIRQRCQVFFSSSINWLDDENQQSREVYLKTLLSPLDELGDTIRDPQLVEEGYHINPDRLEKLLIRS